jgi:H+-transporting ATPase
VTRPDRLEAATQLTLRRGSGLRAAKSPHKTWAFVDRRSANSRTIRDGPRSELFVAASVVLTEPGLGGIVTLEGRVVYQRILTWVINKISRTILKAGFVTVAFLATGRFVISAFGMLLLVFLTDFAKIALATDRIRWGRRPETWRGAGLIRLAVVLGVAMVVEACGLLLVGWRIFGLDGDTGALQTFTFQLLFYFALFSILSVRERRRFWASRPSGVLTLALR